MHQGYDRDDFTVDVPAPRETPARGYRNAPMRRDEATDIEIAFGLAMACGTPIRRLRNGAGFDDVVPMEFIANLPAVREMRERLAR